MKRTLWVASSVAALALPVGAIAARGIAGARAADLGSLQQATRSMSVIDLTTTQKTPCKLDCKTHQDCSMNYKSERCHCGSQSGLRARDDRQSPRPDPPPSSGA